MTRKNAIGLYLLGTLGQIGIVCIAVFILRKIGLIVDYTTPAGLAAIALGGLSSAVWGTIVAVKYKKYDVKKILKDFFNVKQKIRHYVLVLLFLSLDFLHVAFQGEFSIPSWHTPIVLFLKMILFGGIEEIGWRYVFQPVLQERCNCFTSTILTFAAWGVWHFAYFYIEGTLPQVQILGFLAGLLTNCFILSALYIKTNSLWICVMTHSLINVFSQLAVGGNPHVLNICRIIIILAVVLSDKVQMKQEPNKTVIHVQSKAAVSEYKQ